MSYTMKTLAEAAGLPYETVRYYCKVGLVPQVDRNASNYRVFTEEHVAWVKGLSCLRDCGMGIEDMRHYLRLCLQGEETIPERQAMLEDQRRVVQAKISVLVEMLDFIDAKQDYYAGIRAGEIPYEVPFGIKEGDPEEARV